MCILHIVTHACDHQAPGYKSYCQPAMNNQTNDYNCPDDIHKHFLLPTTYRCKPCLDNEIPLTNGQARRRSERMHAKNWPQQKVQEEVDRLKALWEVTLAAKILVGMAEGKGGEDEKKAGRGSSETIEEDDTTERDGGKDNKDSGGFGHVDDEFKDGTWWRKGVPRGF